MHMPAMTGSVSHSAFRKSIARTDEETVKIFLCLKKNRNKKKPQTNKKKSVC